MGGPLIAQPLKFLRRAGPHRVLVIGGGLAGLFTALKLAPLPVTVLSPKPLGEGASSTWAQGGIAAAIGEGDTAEAHAADTIAAGAGLTDPEIASILTAEAGQRIEDLLGYGVPFDRDGAGKPRLSQEAAHSARRIVRVGGDQAGKAVMASLIAAVAATPSISVLENTEAVELVYKKGRVRGVYVRRTGEAGACLFPAGLRGCAGDRRRRRALPGHDQPQGGGRRRPCHGGARGRHYRRSRVRAVPPDRVRYRARSGAAAVRGDPGRWRAPGERERLALHASGASACRTGAPRRGGPRRAPRNRRGQGCVPRLPRAAA